MRLDALTLELLRNYLHGAVEDMAYAVERTAHTTFVKETADFTCGLLNPSGEFFAYPVELGVASFKWEQGPEVLDDHIALNRAGIPAIDIIDFDYPHWHRLSDTPDKCSAESMANVAKVLMAWLERVK